MANKHLILLLGKGQKVLTDRMDTTYRKAKYVLPDRPNDYVETPFVGEAIINLYKDRFTYCHIFGTTDSMWETLYARLVKDSRDESITDYFLNLSEYVSTRIVDEEKLTKLCKAFEDTYNMPAKCYIIRLGKIDNELWEIFNSLINIKLESGDEISIDITHGLRFQPIILMLSLFYFTSIRRDIKLGSIFYGGLEMQSDFNGFAPILDLKPLGEMVNWIDAANSFINYDDTKLLTDLLISKGDNRDLAKRLTYFVNLIHLNTLTGLTKNAKNLFLELEKYKNLNDELKAFQVMLPALKEFPKQVSVIQNSSYAVFLVAKRNWDKGQTGLAILTLWEALIERLGELCRIDVNKKNNYEKLTRSLRDEKVLIKHGFSDFYKHFSILSKYRNGIAHAEQGNKFNPNDVIKSGKKLFDFFEGQLFSSRIEELAKIIKIK